MKKVKIIKYKLKASESDIRKLTRDYLRIKGWFVFHLLQGLGCYRGVTDLVAIKNSRVLFIELKKPGGRQTSKQKDFQALVEAHGGKYFLVDCYEDLLKID